MSYPRRTGRFLGMTPLTELLSSRGISVDAFGGTVGAAFPGRAAVRRLATTRGGRAALFTVDLAPRSSRLLDGLGGS